MENVYVKSRYAYLEPMEALIEFYENGYSIQHMVNAFLEADVHGYNRERIKKLLLNYKSLKATGDYQCPTDIELEENDESYPDGTQEKCEVYVGSSYSYEGVVKAIISWYEDGVSISNMLEKLRDDDIESYTMTRIQNLIKIYKKLKKAGKYGNPTDVELEEVVKPVKRKPTEKKEKTYFEEVEEKVEEVVDEDLEEDLDEDTEEDFDEVDDLTDSRLPSDSEIEKIVDDPLPIFGELNNHVMMVAKGLTAALLVTGPGGIGKSYSVHRVLSTFGREKKDFVVMKGKCTASAMYDFLFKNHDRICVFDDCDSVLCDKEGLAVLKGALDSGKDREISWNTRGADMVDTFDCDTRKQVLEKLEKWSKRHGGRRGIPTHFQFEGSVIFISNMSRQEIKAKDSALLTRCSVVDISISNDEVIERLDSLLPDFKIFDVRGKNISNKKMMREVFDWISSEEFRNHPRMTGKNLDFRLFIKAYKARYAKIPKWKEMAFAS